MNKSLANIFILTFSIPFHLSLVRHATRTTLSMIANTNTHNSRFVIQLTQHNGLFTCKHSAMGLSFAVLSWSPIP